MPTVCSSVGALAAALERHDKAGGLPLVAVHAANNETGVIQPLARISAVVKAAGGMLVVDAVAGGWANSDRHF